MEPIEELAKEHWPKKIPPNSLKTSGDISNCLIRIGAGRHKELSSMLHELRGIYL